MDFSKSPCLKYATKFNKAIAARIYAHVNEKSELTIDNGTPGWNLSFGAVNTDMAIDYAIRSVSDGWAIYQLIDPAKGQAAVFLVQYMFGDMTGKNEACLLGPDAPMPVSVDEIAPVAVKMYAEHLVAKPAPTLEGMRRQLKDYLIAASAAVTGDPVLAQFPAEVRPFLKEGCADNQKKGLPADAVTRMDIDGDGRQDYLIDWGGLTCDGALFFGTAGYPKDIIMGTSHGLVKVLEADDQGAEVKRFKGFATFEGAVYAPAAAGGDMRYHDMYVLKHGKAYKVRSIPKGGKVVHTFGG
jgi:hypothetical protein